MKKKAINSGPSITQMFKIIVKNFKTSINMSKNSKEKIDTASEGIKNLSGEIITIKVIYIEILELENV